MALFGAVHPPSTVAQTSAAIRAQWFDLILHNTGLYLRVRLEDLSAGLRYTTFSDNCTGIGVVAGCCAGMLIW